VFTATGIDYVRLTYDMTHATALTHSKTGNSGWDPVTGLGSLRVKPFLDWYTSSAGPSQSANSGSTATIKPSAGAIVGYIVLAIVVIGVGVGVLVGMRSKGEKRRSAAISNPTYDYASGSGRSGSAALSEGLLA
jgi:hypothetical protein